jgi:hypothetical protein
VPPRGSGRRQSESLLAAIGSVYLPIPTTEFEWAMASPSIQPPISSSSTIAFIRPAICDH